MKGTRIGTSFSKMMLDCPVEISQYALCVSTKGDDVTKKSCELEFRNLMKCFSKVSFMWLILICYVIFLICID